MSEPAAQLLTDRRAGPPREEVPFNPSFRTELTYKNYRVTYLSEHQLTPSSVQDDVNPGLWVCEDIIPALSEDAALQQILQRGAVPVRARLIRKLSSQVSQDYKTKFMLAILFAVQSGSSVGAAMEQAIEAESWPLRGQLDPALRLLRAGASFSEAIAILGIYDETTLSIISAGEHTGTMMQSLSAALNHLRRKSTADALMKSAVGMIMLDIFMAMTSSLSAVLTLLPQAEKQGLQTKDVAVLAHWHSAIHWGYVSNWTMLGLAGVMLGFAMFGWAGYEYGAPELREKVEHYLRKLPFLGQALVHEAIAGSTAIASHLLKGGVLFTNAADITSRTIRLPLVRHYWDNVLEQVMSGAPVNQALSRAPLTSAEQRIVAAHTNAAQLAEAFTHISEFRQTQAIAANKRFVIGGLISSFAYSALGIASTLYINYIQITGIMSASSS